MTGLVNTIFPESFEDLTHSTPESKDPGWLWVSLYPPVELILIHALWNDKFTPFLKAPLFSK